jgi:hypothetical protein
LDPILAQIVNLRISCNNERVRKWYFFPSCCAHALPIVNYNTQFQFLNISWFLQAFESAGVNNLRALYKFIDGFAAAPPIPAMEPAGGLPPAVAALFEAAPPLPGLNVLRPAVLAFPQTTAVDLTMAEIGYLARWYNNTFGILEGDDAGAQRTKLRDFLTGFA